MRARTRSPMVIVVAASDGQVYRAILRALGAAAGGRPTCPGCGGRPDTRQGIKLHIGWLGRRDPDLGSQPPSRWPDRTDPYRR